MKIIYKQIGTGSFFENFGIKNCCLKKFDGNNEIKNVTKKEHYHTGFEIHIIESGNQIYEINGEKYKIEEGSFLLLSPNLKHYARNYSKVSKISVTFSIDTANCFASLFSEMKNFTVGKTNKYISDNIKYILSENEKSLFFSPQITENRVFELIVSVLRLCGFKEVPVTEPCINEDARFSMAKQYINDNIEMNLKVSDIAAYCYLGEKQLTRLFKIYGNTTPAACIKKQKIEYIEKLLCETSLTLHEISEKMNFSSEYHFNSFFKKYAGMTPGEYRKMLK